MQQLTIIFSTIALKAVSSYVQRSNSCALPCLPIQITEFAVLRLNFGGVELGMVGQNILPPLLLIELFQVDQDALLILCVSGHEHAAFVF